MEAATALVHQKYSVGQAHVYAVSGRRRESEQTLRQLDHLPDASDPFFLAGVYAALGNRDKAFALLDRAYDERTSFLSFINVFPWMDPLRPDPRFARLVMRLGQPALPRRDR